MTIKIILLMYLYWPTSTSSCKISSSNYSEITIFNLNKININTIWRTQLMAFVDDF